MIIHPRLFVLFVTKFANRYQFSKNSFLRFFLIVIKKRISRTISKNKEDIIVKGFQSSFTYDQKIKKLADRICEDYLSIFSIGERKIDEIDWHLDYRSNFRWQPNKFYRDYKIVDKHNEADVKIPWEISRSHHFLILGQAYLMTNDEKYTKKFIEHINDWIDENPFMKSINWTCTMEVAIRAVNWLYALRMFAKSTLMTSNIKHKILVSLYQHGYFIFRNPEKSAYNNHNHYLSDLAGQIHLGIFFKGLPEADLWLKEGIFEFYKEIRTQILPTGPTYERSTSYHRLVTEIIAYTIIHLERNGYEIPTDIKYRVETMFEFIMYYLRQDGTAPIIGDQDDGRFLPFSINQNIDHRYLLTIAAIYFARADFKSYSSGYNTDAFFTLGEKSKLIFHQIPQKKIELESKSFKDAGFFIMRKNDNYLFINNSGKGRYPEVPAGTHTHSDLLSFDLTVKGIPFMVDSGTYLYSANPKERKLFRSTAMHNTAVIDDQDQNILKEEVLWDFERNAIPKLLKWKSTKDYDIFEGEHNGYTRLKPPVIHRRKIIFDKNNTICEITDYFEGEGEHIVKIYFNFNDNITVEKHNNDLYAHSANESISIKSKNSDYETLVEDSYISKSYGSIISTKRVFFKTNSLINPSFQTIIQLYNK